MSLGNLQKLWNNANAILYYKAKEDGDDIQ
jgi:hypothetical protein